MARSRNVLDPLIEEITVKEYGEGEQLRAEPIEGLEERFSERGVSRPLARFLHV